jgi:hypothetical protein
MKLTKNIVMLIAAFVLVAGIVGAGSTVAMLTAKVNILNTFKTAVKIDTEINENLDPDDIATETDILKQPYVKNNSGAATLIRARITISPSDLDVTLKSGTWSVNGQVLDVYDPATLSGDKTFTANSTVYSKDNGFASVTDAEGKGWIYSDGWYYYNVVTEGYTDYANTTTLFDAVYLGKDIPEDAEIDITVYQESVYAGDHTAGDVVNLYDIKSLFE